MQLRGLHHVTAISAAASGNHAFYTGVMGMRLVKKTVNQDDTSAYHLFYADGEGRPGTDLTFFDWPVPPERRGSGCVVQTALRVAGADALAWWGAHLREAGVAFQATEQGGQAALAFQDAEGQRLLLVDDGGTGDSRPWAASPVPAPYQIRGLGPVTLSVRALAATQAFLIDILGMRLGRAFAAPDGCATTVFTMGEGGLGAELHVRTEPGLSPVKQGAGGVHHVAFRIPNNEYEDWVDRLRRLGVQSSGPVDRFYFRSLYVREPGGVLCEIATEGPGFGADEAMDAMGQGLALPPFLESRRREIEAGLRPL